MSLADALSREYSFVRSVGRTFYRMRRVGPDAAYTISDIVEEFARTRPRNVALVCEAATITYRQLDERANRVARWALAQGLRPGDAVGLFMENRPEYLIAWLGIVKIGGVVALINTNLRGRALAHSLDVADVRCVIVGHELATAYQSALTHFAKRPAAWFTGGLSASGDDLDAELALTSPVSLDRAVRHGLTAKHNAFYIYTSGTTGLPKAANFSHMRMLFMMYGFAGALGARETDRMYDVLPLYHSTGGVCAVGVAFTTGGCLILRRKFSASEFWGDCVRYQATYFQYIGELCRYLLNTAPARGERDHCLKAITGNGLRPEIWPQFQKRFAIPKIIEFYGATEGNVGMLNYDGRVGAVGRIPGYMRTLIGTRLVRFDTETEMPIRDEQGFCTECAPDEIGEAIGRIEDRPGRGFEGYTQTTETSRKILRDVFEKGDAWFRTGDLMRRDKHNYFYFVDRVGDTFRWKGENVATSEVTAVLSDLPGVQEVSVYGVSVPGHDGRAGMAALVTEPDFAPEAIGSLIAPRLPSFARPLFLRLSPILEVTGTFKHRKQTLVREGFDPRVIVEPIFWFNSDAQRYERLGAAEYLAVIQGDVRL